MTTPDRWQAVQRVVDGALDLPSSERAAYVASACGEDVTLHEEATRLLDACERAGRAGGIFAAPAVSFAAQMRGDFADRYAVERELGRGGMATVYLARDLRHDRQVAVKVLESHVAASGAERFLREIRIAARLTHPHVLGVHDSGESWDPRDGADGRRLYYVMPYVAGETLRARLTREGALPLADAMRLLRELADALAYAHANGVMHRDLKPENVLLSGGHAVVADFGIAKAIAAATSSGDRPDGGSPKDRRPSTLTATGMAIGTPAYMAPEQAVGDAMMDHRADLYALGLIAYEMVAGTHPFAGRTAQALATAHLTETPQPLAARRSDTPPRIAALVMRLLAKDPAARPQSAEEVVRALDGVPFAPGETPRRGQRVAFAAATLLLVLGAVGYAVWRRTNAPEAVAASIAPIIHSVAVLPFVNTSGDRQDDYFSDGLTDELSHALTNLPGLRIAGRDASYTFKGRHVAAQEVGRVLGVDAFVSATVRRSGDRLRVNPQLVSTADGSVLWDSVYESRSGDVFAVQDSLTRSVAAALVPALGTGGPRGAQADRGARPVGIARGRGTRDAEAYELYLKGMYYWHERGKENVVRSIGLFQQAIARDPTFARAYAGLASAYGVLGVYVSDPADSTTPLIKASALHAVTLDSTLADAQLAIAGALMRDFRFADAERHFQAALRIEPSNVNAHHVYGTMLAVTGRTDSAIAELRRATRLDPLAKSAGTMLAEALSDARRFREADSVSRGVLAVDPTFPLAIYSLGLAQVYEGQPDSAVRTLERGVRLYPPLIMLKGRLLFAYAAAGRWDDAERMRAQLRQPGVDRSGGALPAFADLVLLGDREPLMRLLATRAGQLAWFDMLRPTARGTGCNPIVDLLWADERYRAVMGGLGFAPCPQVQPWPLPPRNRGPRTNNRIR